MKISRYSVRGFGLWLGAIVLAIGLCLNLIFYPYAIATETINLNRDRDRILVGRLYIPDRTAAPFPTIVLWHGVSSSKELVDMLAIELARHGIAALSFDSGGFGESYARPFSNAENLDDARVVFNYVKQHPDRFDPSRLGMGGHSMGAATAIDFAIGTADAAKIRVTLDLGMSADVSPVLPANLFMGIGLYEEFHTPDAMRETLQQATDPTAREFQLKGDFKKGTARKLVISSTSDHLIEPFDPTLIQSAVEWSMRAFDLPDTSIRLTVPLTTPFVMWGWFLTSIGSILTVGYGLRDLQFSFTFLFTFLQAKLRFVAGGIIAIAALFLYLGMAKTIPPKTATSLILLAAAILPVSTFAIAYPKKLTSFFRMSGLYIAVILVAYTIVALITRCTELFFHPIYLLGLPQFMAQMLVALIYSRFQEFNAAMFPSYSNALVPNWQLSLLFLPELIYPALLLGFGTRSAVWSIKWLRQPLKISVVRPSNRSLLLVVGLILVFAIVLFQQARAGVVSLEYAITALRLIFQMTLFPAFLIILMVRSPQFQKLESRCLPPPLQEEVNS